MQSPLTTQSLESSRVLFHSCRLVLGLGDFRATVSIFQGTIESVWWWLHILLVSQLAAVRGSTNLSQARWLPATCLLPPSFSTFWVSVGIAVVNTMWKGTWFSWYRISNVCVGTSTTVLDMGEGSGGWLLLEKPGAPGRAYHRSSIL